jgi:hypothetical protein
MTTQPAQIGNSDEPFWSHRAWAYLAAAVLLLCTAIVALTFLDYGVTYDEEWRLTYGKYVVDWYLSGFKDASALHFWVLSLQGGFTAALEHLAASLSPLGRYETAHLVNALFGLLGLIGVYKLGTLLGGRVAGFLALVMFALTPRYFGDMFNNMSDVPTASLTVFSVYYLVQLLRSLPGAPKRLVLKLGAVIGLALGIRTGAVLLVVCVGAGLFMWLLRQWLLSREPIRRLLSLHLLKLILVFIGVCLTAYLTMLVWWPAAQVRPFYQPAKGLWWATHFEYELKVLFDGSVWSNRDLPWYYLSKSFLITMPEFSLFGLGLGLVLLTWLTLRRGIRSWIQADLGIVVIAIVSLFPILYSVLTAPPEFDGIRHFLFVLPGLTVLAAFSLAEVLRRGGRWLRIGVLTVFIGSLLLTGVDMVRLHPYQYVYFNRLFAGGLKTAAGSFETDYWGASYKEGVEWLCAHYPVKPGRRPKVASCLHPVSTSYFLPQDRFEFIGSYHGDPPLSERPDIFLATTRWGCDQKETGRVLHTVSRMGVPLLFVIEVNPSIRQLSTSASERQ